MSSPSPEPAPASSAHGTATRHGAGPGADEDVRLLDRFAVLSRYRAIAATVFVLTTFAMLLQSYTSAQLHQAQAQLRLDDRRPAATPGLTTTDAASVGDREEVTTAPMMPTGWRTWLVSMMIGLGLAVAVAYGLDYVNDTIKTPEDITRYLTMTLAGLIPSVPSDRDPVLSSSHVPYDFGESFRSLRTALVAQFPSAGGKTLVVTSAQPLEGKTTTAANIALALAYGGARVLLIDADLRRPGIHRPLGLPNERGLSHVLMGQARVRDAIQRTVDPNLLAMTAGGTPPNPSELLSSERMKALLTNLVHGPFDWIIVDTPPILTATDAVVLAPLVSGVTLVIGSAMTRRRLVERAVETMSAASPKHLSLILNKVDFAGNRSYHSRYHGHQYQNYSQPG